MKYIPDLAFETDEQVVNEFYNSLALDAMRHSKQMHCKKECTVLWSLADLESMLATKGYPQVKGAKEVLLNAIEIKKMILCSGFEHRGSAF